jgi:hypothetical protein
MDAGIADPPTLLCLPKWHRKIRPGSLARQCHWLDDRGMSSIDTKSPGSGSPTVPDQAVEPQKATAISLAANIIFHFMTSAERGWARQTCLAQLKVNRRRHHPGV